ncbi:MAG: bifunctional methylenetetrahydrofolate dehydrogenase/methenyltetrahydrofolate cyclohydrolase [Rhodospirillaceae bacterium TMED8]|mgnify:CR=1 FL=1|nr:bifunctional methylenetetrahydrofolate dehydrogenase/methenyltetrahydrofolate cyclohydrolase FolD [Magnetovibrio sp.]OUT53338.1 MAG: bifunctional methylenetetrahydrofolate dehydrogenase/methenyltetrahydrofolate cyclohydrolase [Rhodospirillaceae bacterium TMED8]|tara:strand:+ start:10400 stop:11311 length:912 start_codon:yes stop_codon:yes gene_type:complete
MTVDNIIDGKAFAAGLRRKVAAEVVRLKKDHDITPGLSVVLVGNDPASAVYVRNKGEQTKEAGMVSSEHRLAADTPEADILDLVNKMNDDPSVNGILVQLPLPHQIDENKVLAAINPNKDVDGFHVTNVGRLWTGSDALVPCTPLGCILMLKDRLGDLSGKSAVVIGRSNIVGKPMAALLIAESCTVTIAHSRTVNLADLCRDADIVIAAVGRPEMVKGEWIKPGATVIDVGINRVEAPERGLKEDGSPKTKLVGDVQFTDAAGKAGAITPVPGGVGPMTIACLLRNTLVAACRQNGIAPPPI